MKYLLFLIWDLKSGNCKKIHHQFHTNHQKSTSWKNFILIQTISHMQLVHKLTIFYVGKNHNNALFIIFHLNKLKEF